MNIKLMRYIDSGIISFMVRFSVPDHVLPSNDKEGSKAPANNRIQVFEHVCHEIFLKKGGYANV